MRCCGSGALTAFSSSGAALRAIVFFFGCSPLRLREY